VKKFPTEQEVIGDLQRRFAAPDPRFQTRRSFSVDEILGALALAYYRGIQVGQRQNPPKKKGV
jgi:hypothetical protein